MSGQILIVVHQQHSTPGRIGAVLERRGYRLDIRRHACGDPLPERLDNYAAAVVFGGPMSANDDHLPFVRNEIDWINRPLEQDVPFLGVCLGGQLLARTLGARVFHHPEGFNEIGYYPVRRARPDCALFAPEQHFYQWHNEGFDAPAGSTVLATGDWFPVQAFGYRRAVAIQFHPEVTREMMVNWSRKATHRMVLRGAQSREAHLNGHARHDAAVEAWLDRLFDRWLAPAAAPVLSAAE